MFEPNPTPSIPEERDPFLTDFTSLNPIELNTEEDTWIRDLAKLCVAKVTPESGKK